MKDLLQELQETFFTEIPITQHIGISVASYDNRCLTLSAPLERNINHQRTAFAGSLNALVTLAGWGMLWIILKELGMTAVIVIQDSSSNYLRPVTGDFAASCYKPDQGQLAKLKNMLKKKGVARLELRAEIRQGQDVAVAFKGRYVVYLKRQEDEGDEELFHNHSI